MTAGTIIILHQLSPFMVDSKGSDDDEVSINAHDNRNYY